MTSRFVDPQHYSLDAPQRQFFSTDDVAVFLDDTLDESTVKCISNSPSAVAILSPQRLSAAERPDADFLSTSATTASSLHHHHPHPHNGHSHHTGGGERLNFGEEVSQYDDMASASNLAFVQGMSMSARKKAAAGRRFADVTNGQLHDEGATFPLFSTPTSGTKKQARTPSDKRQQTPSALGKSSSGALDATVAFPTFTPKRRLHSMMMSLPGSTDVTTVSLAEWERVERERSRYQKMYEHQRSLYDDMAQRHQEAQQKLQDKIVEVVALSTRNEESKRFIRQLKKEIGESRTRVLDMSNRQLEERRLDRQQASMDKMKDALEEQYSALLQERDVKMAGLEGLLRDLTQVKGESARLQVSQLDQLLKASYAKNAALFGDLFRQNRQLESLMDSKLELERTIDHLRRERREFDSTMATERRIGNQQNERFLQQVQEQQQMITELRQMLVRTMENAQQHEDDLDEEDEEEEEDQLVLCEEEDYVEHERDIEPSETRGLTARHRRSPYDEDYCSDENAAHTPRVPTISHPSRPQLRQLPPNAAESSVSSTTPGVLIGGGALWDSNKALLPVRPSSRPVRAIPHELEAK